MIDQSLHSPNHSPRGANRVTALVIHATGGEFPGSLAWLTNPQARVSAHYLIGRNGLVARLVDESRAAWHAGVSRWRGLEVWSTTAGGLRVPSVNPVSIGIELVNRNDGRDPYDPAQVEAAIALCRGIVARHAITRGNLVRHSDIAVPRGRKTDPLGLHWESFVAGVFPPPELPPPIRHFEAKYRAYVREASTTKSAHIDTVFRKQPIDVVRIVDGQRLGNQAAGSNQWAERAEGGFIWLPQLRETSV